MKNHSDISQAPCRSRANPRGACTHTHTHTNTHTLYISVMKKRANSCMSFESQIGNWCITLCTFLSASVTAKHTHRHTCTRSHFRLSSGVREGDMSHQSNPPGAMEHIGLRAPYVGKMFAFLGSEPEV